MNHDQAYSVLQALIISAAKVLSIDEGEIQGTLDYYKDYDNGNYEFVLYDKTPGGAGHVKRLVESESSNMIYKLFKAAFDLANECHCDEPNGDAACYNCLCTYQNQKNHDLLKRRYVIEVLGDIINSQSNNDSQLEDRFYNKLKKKSTKVISSNDEYITIQFGNEVWELRDHVWNDKRNNVLAPTEADYILTPITNTLKKAIAIYTDGFLPHHDQVNDDTNRRNAMLYSGNYLVWTLSWDDVIQSKKDYSKNIFSDITTSSCLNITKDNSFDLLLYYLSIDNSMNDFTKLSDDIIKYIKSKQVKCENLNIDFENFELNKIISSNIYKYQNEDENIQYYLSDNNGKTTIISYLNDDRNFGNVDYKKDWNAFWQINNILQFSRNLFMITKKGVLKQTYKNLHDFRENQTSVTYWNNGMDCSQNTRIIIDKSKKNNILAPDEFLKESSEGYVCEFVWENLKIVFLNAEQIEDGSKESFEKDGYKVISTFEEIIENVK